MEYRILDEKTTHPVSDIILHNNKTIVSCYDRSLKAYFGNTLLSTVYLPTPITKMCSYFEKILAISMTSGLLYIFDGNLALIDVIGRFAEPSIIFKAGRKIVISCYSKSTYILGETEVPLLESESFQEKIYPAEDIEVLLNQPHSFETLEIKEHPKIATSGEYLEGRIAISFENILVITDEEFRETYSKEFSCCINSVAFYDDGILVGLINGKIHCENFSDSEESFVFNSHVDSKPTKKTFFPSTQLLYKKYLYSAGADGKIIKWDLENKRQILTVFEGPSCVKKFVLSNNKLFVLLDDILEIEQPSKLVYIPFEV